MSDNTVPADAGNPSLTHGFGRAAMKVGRDFIISTFLNGFAFVSLTLPSVDLSALEGHSHEILSGMFNHFAAGTALTTAGMTAGRYIGGAIGMGIDRLTDHDDGHYRRKFAGYAGAAAGLTTMVVYNTGLWKPGGP
jgi:hypothetical protein